MAHLVLQFDYSHFFRYCNGKLSIPTVRKLAQKMISVLWYVHNKGIIHRDVKPDNIMIGHPPNEKMFYLIDFGLSKPFINSKTGQHVQMIINPSLTGDSKFLKSSTVSEVPTYKNSIYMYSTSDDFLRGR